MTGIFQWDVWVVRVCWLVVGRRGWAFERWFITVSGKWASLIEESAREESFPYRLDADARGPPDRMDLD